MVSRGLNLSPTPQDLVVADGSCPQIRQLLCTAEVPVVWLNDEELPFVAVNRALTKQRLLRQRISTLHWVSHGSRGRLHIGDTEISRNTLLANAGQLASWDISSIALWSCHAGADPDFIALLEELTGSSVWSTSNKLGRTLKTNPYWTLESKTSTAQGSAPTLPVDPTQRQQWAYQLNNAPIANGTPTLASISEDATTPAGDTVANLFGTSFSDVDGDSLLGIAITANSAIASEGVWEYSIDNGSNWNAVATTGLADATALYLNATSKIRFVPAADYSGTPGALTARLLDSTFTIESPNFTGPSTNPFGFTDVGEYATPVFADLDSDGDLDAFVGRRLGSGSTTYFHNTGTSTVPAFSAASINPFGITNVGFSSVPVFADIDGDGLLDAFIGEERNGVYYFKNTGTSSSPAFASASLNPFGITDVGFNIRPVFADLDNDGDLDAFLASNNGDSALFGSDFNNIFYFQNTGTSLAPAFASSSLNPFGITAVGGYGGFSLADLDSDGDLDAFLGDHVPPSSGDYGDIVYFENTGTSSAPAFASASSNPFGITPAAYFPDPALADLDSDGDLDAFIGKQSGDIAYFQNTPNSSVPTSGSSLNVSNNGGTTAIATSTLSLGTSVSAVNDAPVNTLPGAQSATEDTSLSITGISVIDVDDNLATTQVTVANGTLTVDLTGGASISSGSNDSADLTLSGSETQINAALATLSYTASANYNGSDTLTIVSTDSAGTPLSDTDTVTINVAAAGDAPTASGTPTLAAITEDATNPGGDTVDNLFGSSFSDADNDTLLGVGIIANSAIASEGVWEYSIDNGSNWNAVATTGLADATAFYLDATSKLRFVPAANYSDTPGELTARLIDSSYSVGATPSFGTSSSSPFGITDVGNNGTPEFADLDGDGDLDAFIGNSDGDTIYFDNTGSSTAPAFAASSSNPYAITDVGALASPVFADLDADGDLDAFIGNWSGNTVYFQNTGTSTAPAFAASSSNPYGITDIGSVANPEFADLDADGDLDAFIGNYDGDTIYFDNTGSSSAPAFAASSSNPFGVTGVGINARPEFADLDGDGDLDAFIGRFSDGKTVYFQNTGSSDAPAFAASSSNAFGMTDVRSNASPVFADLDGDGDLDAIIGDDKGITVYAQNNPTSIAPTTGSSLDISTNGGTTAIASNTLSLGTSVTGVNDAPVNTLPGAQSATEDTSLSITGISVADVDDNLATTQVTVANGTLTVDLTGGASISSGSNASADLTLSGSATQINAALATLSYTASANYNGSDTLTVVSSDSAGTPLSDTDTITINVAAVGDAPTASGTPTLAAITEDATSPAGATVANLFGSSFSDADSDTLLGVGITANSAIASEGVWEYSIDNGSNWNAVATTGLADATAFYLDATSKLRFVPAANYNGTPGALTARLIDSSNSVSNNPFGFDDVGSSAAPELVDIDGDGLLDAFIGNSDGNTIYFKNTGTSNNPSFFSGSTTNPFGLSDSGSLISPDFVDIDGDGLLDIFIGGKLGRTSYYKNTGTSNNPDFSGGQTTNPFGIDDIGRNSAPNFIDIDADGLHDIFLGNWDGRIGYFKNTGTSNNPDFSGGSTWNPFGLNDIGAYSSPFFVDIDGDGLLDALIGNKDGETVYFKNTGSANNPDFSGGSTTNPFGLGDVGNYAAPVFVDIDGDSDLDAFIGNEDGNIFAFHNTGSSTNPSFNAGFGSRTNASVVDVSSNGGSTDASENTLNLITAITAVNDAPVNTVPGGQSTTEDTSLSITGISVADIDGDLTTTQITVANGTLNVDLTSGVSISSGSNDSADFTLNGNENQINAALATLSYTASANYNGSDTLTIVSIDSNSTPLSDSDTVNITITAVDDQAVITGDTSGTAAEDVAAITGTLRATDIEGLTDGTYFSIESGNEPTNGSASINAETGAWSYTPTANFNGTDSFTVTITDDLGGTTTQQIDLTITAVDDQAVITGDTSGTAAEDVAAITGTLTATDIEGLTDGTYFSIESGNEPTNGSASINAETGAWSYTPTANFNGTDSFTVTITDDLGGTTTQQIDLTITAVDDQAVVTGDTSRSVTEDSDTTTATGTLSITDVDADDSPAFADLAETSSDNAYGSFSLTSGTWTYTLDNANTTIDALDDGDTLTDTYTFTATDGTTQIITVTINGADDAPVVSGSLTGFVTEDSDTTTATGTFSITDVDADDSPTFADLAETSSDNAYGSFSLTNGTWTYTLDNANTTVDALDDGDTLTDTYTFTATDGTTQTITVIINGETDPTPSPSPSTSPQPTPTPTPEPTPEPEPSPQPTPEPSPQPTPAPDPTPADTAPLATDVQLSDDDGDGLKEVITAADGALIDGNGDGIADAEQSDVIGLRMINDGAKNTDYGALETDPVLSFSAVSFLSPTEPVTDSTGTGSSPETYAVTTRDGQPQTTSIPTGIDNAFAGLLGFTVSGLSNGGSTSTTISLPQGLNTLDTAQLAYLRFNYATNRFEDFVDSAGTPLYSFQDSNGDGQLDSVVLQLIDGDPAWDGDGIANGSIIDPGFLATGDRKLSGNNKDNTLRGNVLANTLLGKGGSDTLIGDLGNDTLIGNGKQDRLRGGEGDDTLKGKTGDDRLHGGDHDDQLDGGKGDDILIGGSGADRFRLSKGSDTIKDFSIADDDQLLISNATNLTIEQVGQHLLLTDADKDISTTLKGVAFDDLLAHQPELLG